MRIYLLCRQLQASFRIISVIGGKIVILMIEEACCVAHLLQYVGTCIFHLGFVFTYKQGISQKGALRKYDCLTKTSS